MKTALVISPYWDTLGGGERYTATFARFLLDQGWQVDTNAAPAIISQLADRFGIDLSATGFQSTKSISDYELLFWVSDGSLPLSRARKTLIHFQFPFAGVGGRTLKNLVKSRFYTFVCNSRFTKSFIDREFLVDSRVVYPPIDVDHFPPGRKNNSIIYVGRFSHLTQLKNPHLLINAFKIFSQSHPDWNLIIAGGAGVGTTSSQIDTLRQLSQGLKVELVINPDLQKLQSLYAQAKIFWSAAGIGADERTEPLKVEHFGITVVEAMAAGCVPIVSKLGGHKEIVNEGENGFLFSDLDRLPSITANLVGDSQKLAALSQAARAKVAV